MALALLALVLPTQLRPVALNDRLVGLCNEVGLLSESHDVDRKRLVGNFPQARSHLQLVDTAFNIAKTPARSGGGVHEPAYEPDRPTRCPGWR